MTERKELVYLKLGGSLITDKRQPESPRLDVIRRLAGEIAAARGSRPDLQLLIGHGSGSFGHVVGRRYGTRTGVATPEEWYGFAATADAAARLNRIVVAALLGAGIPAWSIQPSVVLRSRDGVLEDGPHAAATAALAQGLTPVVYGDVTLDSVRGGTIASTEEIFAWLIRHMPPGRMLLVGEVDGIYTADPQLTPIAERIETVTASTLTEIENALGGSHGVDVTGGMRAKVGQALEMVAAAPGLEVRICGGLTPNALRDVLLDSTAPFGTRIIG